jgi:alpha-L-fucosidase
MRSYAAFGREIRRRFSKPLAETRGRSQAVTLQVRKPARIGQVSIMEEIAQGERIRQFKVEGLTGAQQWTVPGEAQSVGHKRIFRFAPLEAAAVRLSGEKSAAEQLIRSLAVYET